MTQLTHKKQNQIIDDFLNGMSVERICSNYIITPTQLVELYHSSQRNFVNELFDEPPKSTQTLEEVEYENSELKRQYEILNRKIKEYEIEIRVHKELLETFVANNTKKWKRF